MWPCDAVSDEVVFDSTPMFEGMHSNASVMIVRTIVVLKLILGSHMRRCGVWTSPPKVHGSGASNMYYENAM